MAGRRAGAGGEGRGEGELRRERLAVAWKIAADSSPRPESVSALGLRSLQYAEEIREQQLAFGRRVLQMEQRQSDATFLSMSDLERLVDED